MNKNQFHLVVISIIVLWVTGCAKNNTKYFEDTDNSGLAIFSNAGNAIMSCKINDRPWRTINNQSFLLGVRRYEVRLERLRTNGPFDTLFLTWSGYFIPETITGSTLTLAMSIPHSFSIADLSALQGQRVNIDTVTNGFFTTSLSTTNEKGNGSIYFHTCHFDSIAPYNYSGKMSGLLHANIPTLNITNGRFDHQFNAENFQY